MKKTVTSILAILMVLGIFCPVVLVSANELGIQPRYERFASCHVGLNIGRNGKASCFGQAFTYDTTDKVKVTVTLQKQNGNTWEFVRNWTAGGTQVATVDTGYYVVPGTYRVYFYAAAYNANGGFEEGTSMVSKIVTYK